MKLNLEAIIKKFTAEDGTVDFGKANQAVLGQVEIHTEAIVATSLESSTTEASKKLFEGLGIDGVTTIEGLKSHITHSSGSATELQSQITKLTNDLAEIVKAKTDFESKYNDVNVKVVSQERQNKLIELGVNPSQVQSVLSIIGDAEDYEVASKAFIENKNNVWALGKTGPVHEGGSGGGGKTSNLDTILKEKFDID